MKEKVKEIFKNKKLLIIIIYIIIIVFNIYLLIEQRNFIKQEQNEIINIEGNKKNEVINLAKKQIKKITKEDIEVKDTEVEIKQINDKKLKYYKILIPKFELHLDLKGNLKFYYNKEAELISENGEMNEQEAKRFAIRCLEEISEDLDYEITFLNLARDNFWQVQFTKNYKGIIDQQNSIKMIISKKSGIVMLNTFKSEIIENEKIKNEITKEEAIEEAKKIFNKTFKVKDTYINLINPNNLYETNNSTLKEKTYLKRAWVVILEAKRDKEDIYTYYVYIDIKTKEILGGIVIK